MAWLWTSWDEFFEAVRPVAIKRAAFNLSQRNTRLKSTGIMLSSLEELRDAIFALNEGLVGTEKVLRGTEFTEKAFRYVQEAVFAGETLLLYHRRLATSDAAYGFLHAHDLYEHWLSYSGTVRLRHELSQFLTDCRQLLDGYEQMTRNDERFLLDDLDALPEDLKADFRTARNLFSVGFDEVGLLIAGRAMEGVLRRVAKDRRLSMRSSQGKSKPAHEADFSDLIEIMSRVRWKARGVPLLSKESKALLQFVRTIRNGQAHPQMQSTAPSMTLEIGRIIAVTANALWESVSRSRAKLDPIDVLVSW